MRWFIALGHARRDGLLLVLLVLLLTVSRCGPPKDNLSSGSQELDEATLLVRPGVLDFGNNPVKTLWACLAQGPRPSAAVRARNVDTAVVARVSYSDGKWVEFAFRLQELEVNKRAALLMATKNSESPEIADSWNDLFYMMMVLFSGCPDVLKQQRNAPTVR
jgi:hypothetical protein